ncbi:MAG: hypothetical protein R3F39_15265 [Myxococcota bacterium]
MAYAVSGDGRVVAGRSCVADNGGNPCWGIIWTPEWGLVDLGKLLEAGGASLGSHHVGGVYGASFDGRVLVGQAHIGTGKFPEAFALQVVVPE